MAVSSPVTVPKKNISSTDIVGFSGGLNLLGDQNAKGNQITKSSNLEMTPDGFLTNRRSLQRWLPDTIGTVYQIAPVLISGVITYFTADNGKIRWCVDGADSWTDCIGANSFTTNTGVKTTFLRVLDSLLIMNGVDKLAYVDIKTKTVVKYTPVADPTDALTATSAGITGSTYKIYYAYTYSSKTGETKLSPILTTTVTKPRDTWNPSTDSVTVTRPTAAPVGAISWNLYIAISSNGGTVLPTDMLSLAAGLDIGNASLTDNGSLAIDIGRGTAPLDNSTDGPVVQRGIETQGRPILFGDVNNPYNIWIGGNGAYALDFSASHGGFRAEVSKGTNYYPVSVIGFRNNQGIPSLTILFSNTEGLSKQATLEQQTINYGNQTFVVWGVTEQNYGAAGVASLYGVINYNGALSFPSTDGFMSMDTQPQLQNVLATRRIGDLILPYFKSINTGALKEIVGTAWDNRAYWIIPAYGFTTPNQIAVRDLNNNGAWYTLDIPAQWIGTVSPLNSNAFVYICQGNKILKLSAAFGTVDYKSSVPTTFSTSATGALMGMNDAHNGYTAVVQAVFYLVNIIGDITVGVNYRNESGKIKTKQKTFHGPKYVASSSGGWSDPQYISESAGMMIPAQWDSVAKIDTASSTLQTLTKRVTLQMNVLASEVQWWLQTPNDYCSYLLRAVSFEGESLGIKPDLR